MATEKPPAAATKPAASRTGAARKASPAKSPAVAGAKPAAAKPAAKPVARKPAAKPAAKAPAKSPAARAMAEVRHLAEEAPVIASAVFDAVKEGVILRKKDLIERVTLASGAKKKSVKDIIEATLNVLGEALEKGEELILPPFGKAKVNRSRDHDGGKTMMVKLRRGNEQSEGRKAARKGAKEGLADPED